MRALFLTAILCVMSIGAEAGCRESKINLKTLVTSTTPGYQKVQLELKVPFADENSKPNIRKQHYLTLGLHTSFKDIRADINGHIRGIQICRETVTTLSGQKYRNSSLLLKTLVRAISGDGAAVLFSSNLLLPDSIVAEKPSAETLLNTGVSYSGQWIEREGKPVLVLEPITDKPEA